MKRHLLSILFLTTISFSSLWSQSCTPDQIAVLIGLPGVYPNPVQQSALPSGSVGTAYSERITIITLADTTIDLSAIIGFPVPPVTASVNYQEVTNVTGLPSGMSYSCNPSNCLIPGDSSGCVALTGTPTQGGTFTVGLTTGINIAVPSSVPVLGGQNITVPVPGISWDLEITSSAGVVDAVNRGFTLGQNVPNPVSGSTDIHFTTTKPAIMELTVMDLAGRVVAQQSQRAFVGEQVIRFDATSLEAGVYLIRLSNGQASQTRKMVVVD